MAQKIIVFFLFFLSFTTNAQTTSLNIPTFQAEYQISHNDIEIGRVNLEVKRLSNNEFELLSVTKTSGLLAFFREDDVVESSRFSTENGQLRPLHYQYKEDLGESKKNLNLLFNWQEPSVKNSVDGNDWSMKITDRTLDKALMQIALMVDLPTKEKRWHYEIADGGHLKRYQFDRVTKEKITIGKQTYQTTKLARLKDKKKTVTYYWCAEELANLPVLLQREKSYGTFEMRLITADFSD